MADEEIKFVPLDEAQQQLFLKHLIDHQKRYHWMIYGKPVLSTLIKSLSAEYIDLYESVKELQDELSKAADMAVLAWEFVNGVKTLEELSLKLEEHFNPKDDDLMAFIRPEGAPESESKKADD